MILHLLPDDKFSDYVIHQFSEPEMCSEFVLMATEEHASYFKNIAAVKVIDPSQSDRMTLLFDSLADYSAIVLHGLFFPWCEAILRHVPEQVKVAWVFWGGEVYSRKDLRASFLSKRSKRLLRLHQLMQGLKHKKPVPHFELPKELFQRIDYCLTDIHEDYEFVKSYCGFEAKELWYNYYSIEETLGDLRDQTVNGNNILIGNSCTLECNHWDGFRAAQKLQGEDSQIIVPLSYGEPWLRRGLLRIGKSMFGKRFRPLVDFMPRDEYNKIIESCAVVIMPHYRPQAFGNILTALWLGSRVFMSERSHLFKFYQRIGLHVFSIENDLKKDKVSPLPTLEREENRRIIASLYDKEVMREQIINIVNAL
ncbi:MAG: hypothetical protein J6W26_08265 [Bacteroidales bacterium]|nr:hypothetical protein [Bacteroidales bacterium]